MLRQAQGDGGQFLVGRVLGGGSWEVRSWKSDAMLKRVQHDGWELPFDKLRVTVFEYASIRVWSIKFLLELSLIDDSGIIFLSPPFLNIRNLRSLTLLSNYLLFLGFLILHRLEIVFWYKVI